MAFWNQDDEGEWEKYRKSKEKESQEPEEKKTRPVSEEFREYFKTARQAQSPESEEAEQPEEKASSLQTFLSRFRGEKPEEPEGPPEKCPWCGGDMVKGYLSSSRDLQWTRKKPGLILGTMTCDGGFSISDEDSFMPRKTAWYCPQCRKITIDVAGDDEIPEAIRKTMSPSDLNPGSAGTHSGETEEQQE